MVWICDEGRDCYRVISANIPCYGECNFAICFEQASINKHFEKLKKKKKSGIYTSNLNMLWVKIVILSGGRNVKIWLFLGMKLFF